MARVKDRKRKWLAPGWIPDRTVTLLQGDGGRGKSSIVQQLQSSCAVALAWLGLPVRETPSLGIYTEDEALDLDIRQDAIDVIMGQDCVATGLMHMIPMAGEDTELVVFDQRGNPTLTRFYHQVWEAALDYHVGLVTLDVAVDLYGGNEIMRRQVRAFIRPLHTLARKIDGSVVLTGHVSGAGLQSDGGHSASTDWSNCSRSRLYLGVPKGDNDSEADPDARLMTRKKANFASIGDTLKLRWQNGVLVPQESMPSYFRRPVEDVFLALLDEHNAANRRPLSESNNATNYAPRVFASLPDKERDSYREADFRRAMETLFKDRKIASVPYGRRGDERRKIVRNVGEGEERS